MLVNALSSLLCSLFWLTIELYLTVDVDHTGEYAYLSPADYRDWIMEGMSEQDRKHLKSFSVRRPGEFCWRCRESR
jgi:hypothetical protein